MRFVHTADWHLGRLFHGLHLTDDQHHVLEQVVGIVKQEKPDAVLIAGDVYDRAVPPPDAVDLLDEVLSRIVIDARVPVVLIAGNHDSPNRLSFGARLMRDRRLFVVGNLRWPCHAISFADDHGPVHVYAVPYAEPSVVRYCLACDGAKDHDAAMRELTTRLRAGHPPGTRAVLVAHAFVNGSAVSESERPLTVGGTGSVSAECFEGFAYVALGHLHRPQQVACDGNGDGAGMIRYPGSLMKYSFDEADHAKGVSVVEMGGDGRCAVTNVPLTPRRDVRRIEGTMAQLLESGKSDPARDDYLEAMVSDDGPVFDAIGRLRSVYPNVMHIRRPEALRATVTTDRPDVRRQSERELFRAFYQHVEQKEMSPGQEEAFVAVVDAMHAADREGQEMQKSE